MAVHLLDGNTPDVQAALLAAISNEPLRVQVADRLLHSIVYREHIVDWDPASGLPLPPPPGKQEGREKRRSSAAAAELIVSRSSGHRQLDPSARASHLPDLALP